MKFIYFLILLLISNEAFSQMKKPETVKYKGDTFFRYPQVQEKEEENGILPLLDFRRHKIDSSKTDGTWIQFYPDNKVAKIFELYNNKADGEWKVFYKSGTVKEEGSYKEWFPEGKWEYYFPSGSLKAVEYHTGIERVFWYGDGERLVTFTGKQTYYYENGRIEKTLYFTDESERTGKWKDYYENGILKRQREFKNGIEHGYFKNWDESGNLISYQKYDKGLITDVWKPKHDIIIGKDSTKSRGYLWEGIKVGKWEELYPNGSIKGKGRYVVSKIFYCGIIPFDKSYSYKSGRWEYRYENGQIKAVGVYTHKMVRIDNNCEGGEERFMSYTTGDWKFFDETGRKVDKGYLISKRLFEEIESSNVYDFGKIEEY